MANMRVLDRNREIVKECASVLRTFRDKKSFILLPILLLLDRRCGYLNRYRNSLNRYRNSFFHGDMPSNIYKIYSNIEDEALKEIVGISLHSLERISYEQFVKFYDICSYINTYELTKEEFSSFFEDVLEIYIGTISSYEGVFSQPKELSEIVSKIYPLEKGMSLYNAFAGTFSLTSFIPKGVKCYGEEINKDVWAIAQMRILAHEKENECELVNANSLKFDFEDNKFDFIYGFPPFRLRLKKYEMNGCCSEYRLVESNFISNSIRSLKNKGKLIVIVSQSFLSGGVEDKRLRRKLIDNKLLDKVVLFPGRTLQATGIPFVMLCLDNNKQDDKVLMLDASSYYVREGAKRRIDVEGIISKLNIEEDDICKLVTFDSIIKEEYDLSLNRHLISIPQTAEETLLLKNILTKVSLKKDKLEDIPFLSISDLKDEVIDSILLFDDVKSNKSKNMTFNILEEDVLLVSSMGESIKPTYFDCTGNKVNISPNIYSYKVNEEKVSKDYLISELQSDFVKNQIARYMHHGASLKRINKSAFDNILIRVPSLEIQAARVKGIKEALIRNKQNEIDELADRLEIKQQSYLNLSTLRHNVGQYLASISTDIDSIYNYFNLKDKDILDLTLSKVTNRTIRDVLSEMKKNIEFSIDYMQDTEKILKKDIVDIKPESILIKDFILQVKSCFKSGVNGVDSNETSEVNNKKKSLSLKIDNKEMKMVFSNLLNNAKKHGFITKSEKYIIKLDFSLLKEESKDYFSIKYYNNGEPFSKGLDFEKYIQRGISVGDKGGKGLGGCFINEVIKQHKGVFRSLLWENEKYPVGFEILLPIEL